MPPKKGGNACCSFVSQIDNDDPCIAAIKRRCKSPNTNTNVHKSCHEYIRSPSKIQLPIIQHCPELVRETFMYKNKEHKRALSAQNRTREKTVAATRPASYDAVKSASYRQGSKSPLNRIGPVLRSAPARISLERVDSRKRPQKRTPSKTRTARPNSA